LRWTLSFLSASRAFSAGDERESCCFLVQKRRRPAGWPAFCALDTLKFAYAAELTEISVTADWVAGSILSCGNATRNTSSMRLA
jgi:hypothetical protein